jgi:hypothetical protein
MFPGKSAGIIQGVASGKKELLRDIPEEYKGNKKPFLWSYICLSVEGRCGISKLFPEQPLKGNRS